MAMTSKQLIRAAIDFTKPERLPMTFRACGVSDVHGVGWNQVGTGDLSQRHTVDEWGCGWERSEVKNMGLVTGHPLADWSAIDSYRWLDPDDPALYEGMEDQFEGSDGKYILTGIFMILFERLHSLRGFENVLTDLYLETEKIEKLADRVTDIQINIIENMARRFPCQIDGINFSDDWGTERSCIIRPDLWLTFFQPRYKRIFDACKAAGWDVWMHSCGKVNDVIGGWIDVGLDVINLLQPNVLGIEEIGRAFAGKICFHSLCDIQTTLPFKGPEEIEDEVVRLLQCWGTPDGGFILTDYGDGDAIGVPFVKKQIMFDLFVKHDRWRL